MAFQNIFPHSFIPRFVAKNKSLTSIRKGQTGSQTATAVVTLKPDKALNHRNYLAFIENGKNALKNGACQLEIDFTNVEQVTMAGLFALYSLSLLNEGNEPPPYSDGRGAINRMGLDLAEDDWATSLTLKGLCGAVEQQLRAWRFIR